MLGLLGLLADDVARGQQPTVQPRRHAAVDPVDDRLMMEPAIAAGPNMVVSVFFDWEAVGKYAALDLSDPNAQWTEGPIDRSATACDLSIAYEAHSGEFLAAALGGESHNEILVCRFGYETPGNQFGPQGWDVLVDLDPNEADKPWIVAGSPNVFTSQEYYVVWQERGGPYVYARSINDGECWAHDTIRVPDPNDPNGPGTPVVGHFCAQPAAYQDGPLYVAWVKQGSGPPQTRKGKIHFLVGEDVNGDPNDPNFDCTDPDYVGVEFERLYEVYPNPSGPTQGVRLIIPLNHVHFNAQLPAGFNAYLVPQLAADPTDPNRLYLAYHDTATDDPNDHDVNIYLHELTKSGLNWTASARIKVNNDETQYESDQFMPSVTVDDAGYVHIIFYDDRNYTDGPTGDLQPDQGCPNPKFDVYYAWAPLSDLDFEYEGRNIELYGAPARPALDFSEAPNHDPKEYIGIAWCADDVWTAYTGTDPDAPADKKGVIWSSLIEW